jgi:hypothetical protein
LAIFEKALACDEGGIPRQQGIAAEQFPADGRVQVFGSFETIDSSARTAGLITKTPSACLSSKYRG